MYVFKNVVGTIFKGIIVILRLFQLSVMLDIFSYKHGLCWNVSDNTNENVGVISQMVYTLSNIRVLFLALMVYE